MISRLARMNSQQLRNGQLIVLCMMASGVIKEDKEPGPKAALVYGQMNELPGPRARIGNRFDISARSRSQNK